MGLSSWLFFINAMDYLLLALGLGFVIFFHELGHFLAAKYCDVKVEQFAVGFGPAIVAWRKGIWDSAGEQPTPAYDRTDRRAFRRRPTAAKAKSEYKSPISDAQAREIGAKLGIGETEYRLNWIPLGGYVKMLGQDDLRPARPPKTPAHTTKNPSARE